MADDDHKPGALGTVAGWLDGRRAVRRIRDRTPDPAGDLERACRPADPLDQNSERRLKPWPAPTEKGGVNDSELEWRLGRVGEVWFREEDIDAVFPPGAPTAGTTAEPVRGVSRKMLPIAKEAVRLVRKGEADNLHAAADQLIAKAREADVAKAGTKDDSVRKAIYRAARLLDKTVDCGLSKKSSRVPRRKA